MNLDTCKSCRARIRWVKTVTGKAMPLDVDPVADGNIIVQEGVARVGDPLFDGTAGERFVSHFATCQQAAQHRKARG